MRKSNLLRLGLCLAVALLELPLMAQGVIVYKKDGTRVKFPYEEIDSIVTYNVGEDVEDDPVDSPTDARAVDLGLSVKWASCNIGAESPEDYGDYFAWGETAAKSSYTVDNSITYNLSTTELQSRGIIDSDGRLTAAYDAATVNWGGDWRMPTLDEINELVGSCTWSWITQNGINGYKVTGPNGNSIFLPAAGYRYDMSLSEAGSRGYSWSAMPDSNSSSSSNYAFSLFFFSGYYARNYVYTRNHGLTVRPVTE